MSEDMTDHVLSAILDQIPDHHLRKAYLLIEKRLGWQSVYIIDGSMACFVDEIEKHVENTLQEIGKWSEDNEEYWNVVCKNEWVNRFSSVENVIHEYEEFISPYTEEQVHDDIAKAFAYSGDAHELMRDTILKHYGVA